MSFPLFSKEKCPHQILCLYEVLNLIRVNKRREILAILADAPRPYKASEIVEIIYKDVPFGVGRKMSKLPEYTSEFDKNVAMRECEAKRISVTNIILSLLTKSKLVISEEVSKGAMGSYPKFYSINPVMHSFLEQALELFVAAKAKTKPPLVLPRTVKKRAAKKE